MEMCKRDAKMYEFLTCLHHEILKWSRNAHNEDH